MSLQVLKIRQEGKRVAVVANGRLALDLPWEQALELARALKVKALAAQQWAQAEQLVADQALLLRAGAPVGLTDNPLIQREAWKAAEDLKLPGGITPRTIVGTPAIHHVPPTQETSDDG